MADVEMELEIEPEPAGELPIEIEPELPLELEDGTTPAPSGQALLSSALVEILPADFQLPLLARFVPNQALKTAVGETVRELLAVDVTAADGLARADQLQGALNGQLKAIDAHFEEPAAVAFELHRHITGLRADFKREGVEAQKTMARRVFDEVERRNALERERRRKEQEEADRRERERLAKEAQDAEAAQAPPEVVEELKQQAQTATAAPVTRPTSATSSLRNMTTTKTWCARIQGTPGTDDPNPTIDSLSPAQRLKVIELLKAIIDGKAPLAAIELNWSYLNKRAKADKSAIGIPGIEAFQQGGVRAKGVR